MRASLPRGPPAQGPACPGPCSHACVPSHARMRSRAFVIDLAWSHPSRLGPHHVAQHGPVHAGGHGHAAAPHARSARPALDVLRPLPPLLHVSASSVEAQAFSRSRPRPSYPLLLHLMRDQQPRLKHALCWGGLHAHGAAASDTSFSNRAEEHSRPSATDRNSFHYQTDGWFSERCAPPPHARLPPCMPCAPFHPVPPLHACAHVHRHAPPCPTLWPLASGSHIISYASRHQARVREPPFPCTSGSFLFRHP